MAYEITLKDSTGEWTSPTPDSRLTVQDIESSTTNDTLDVNVYIDLFGSKKLWTIRWGYMAKDPYNTLRGFYDRQNKTNKFPTVSIPDLGVTDIIVKLTLTDTEIVDSSGLVENVELGLRETIQSTEKYFVS